MCGTKIEITDNLIYFLELKLEFHKSKELPNANIT
jgi:hypothetical protein